MDVDRLALLHELATRGSITEVARATHRTPSAVSQQLKALEREAGTPLVERSGRGVRLTDGGRVLARGAVDIAAARTRARAQWDEFRGHASGTVSVAAFPSAAEMLLPGLLAALRRSDDPIDLALSDIDTAESAFGDLTRDHDLVVAHSVVAVPRSRPRELAVVPLLREPLDVAVPAGHPLAGQQTVTAQDLVGQSWIGVPKGFPFDRVLDLVAAETGETPRVAQRFTDNRVVETFVRAGEGIALLPRFTGSAAPDLVLLRLVGLRAARHVFALARPERLERLAVRRVAEALRAEAGQVEAGDEKSDDNR